MKGSRDVREGFNDPSTKSRAKLKQRAPTKGAAGENKIGNVMEPLKKRSACLSQKRKRAKKRKNDRSARKGWLTEKPTRGLQDERTT